MTKIRKPNTLKSAIYRTVKALGGYESVADYLECSHVWVATMCDPETKENVSMDWLDKLNSLWIDRKGDEVSPIALYFGRNGKCDNALNNLTNNHLEIASAFGQYSAWLQTSLADGVISRTEAIKGLPLAIDIAELINQPKQLLNDIAEGCND